MVESTCIIIKGSGVERSITDTVNLHVCISALRSDMILASSPGFPRLGVSYMSPQTRKPAWDETVIPISLSESDPNSFLRT